ncbi:LPS-assembly protein LptD [Tepidimonas charontis]|nr:LPS assembly protein LptD [Tepidimonas charontis]
MPSGVAARARPGAVRPSRLAGALAATLAPWAAAQSLALQPSLALEEALPPAVRGQVPAVVEGARIHGQVDGTTVVQGQAVLRRHDVLLRAERLTHDARTDRATAEGQVRVVRAGNVFEGERLSLQLDTFAGQFDTVRFAFLRNGGQGEASRVVFLDEQRAVAYDVRYSTCTRPASGPWTPAWAVTADEVLFDQGANNGEARAGRLEFQGVTVLAAPWISFPLSDARKSGVLPPTLNLDNRSGLETTLPYYFNLAPNRDATLYPTLMTRRGLDLGGEYRYLEPTYAGQLRAAWMPSDRLRDRDRWAYALQHQHALPTSAWLPGAGLRLHLNRVSDDDYWRDFPRTSVITHLSQRLLDNHVALSGGHGAWSYSVLAQRWQTLGAAASLTSIQSEQIVAPYDRLPSLALRWAPRLDDEAWQLRADVEATRFTTRRRPTVWDGISLGDQRTDLGATRTLGTVRLGRRWEAPWGYIEPSLRWHLRHYAFEQPLGDGRRSASYALPTLALDSGLTFERNTRLFGRAVAQTLEPRVLLAATPYRDQRLLPVYDSAAYDFNLATIFSPNPYGGNDRIADLRALTYGVTSRLYDSADGRELLTVGLAQRLRLSEQRVTLPNEGSAAEGRSDVLIGASVALTPTWSASGTWQYNTARRTSVRTVLSARYQPGPYRTFHVAYRNNETTVTRSQQLDLAWQWPLAALWGDRPLTPRPGQALGPQQWYGVGRVNYSFTDRRLIDLVAGFEYDAGCWLARVVLERQQLSASSASQRALFQLEFSGFSRLGTNALQALRAHIPRYRYLREDVNPPSRFERYE